MYNLRETNKLYAHIYLGAEPGEQWTKPRNFKHSTDKVNGKNKHHKYREMHNYIKALRH